MSALEDKLAFVHIKSHKQQVLQRITIYVFFIMMLIPLGYGVYKLLMQWDYNNLKHYIESDIMQGYDKLYDYTLSIQDDEIKDIKDLSYFDKKERSASYALFNPSWKNDAFKSKMPRYSEPSMGNMPFSITCMEKNKDGGYDIKQYAALGIVYKYPSPSKSSPIYSYLTQEEAPKNVYNEAFEFICKNWDEYKLSKGSSNDIISILTPFSYTANKAGYDESHTTSLFHSVDRQGRTIELPYDDRGTYGYGTNGIGNVKTDRYTTYYSYSDRYLQIQEHPYNQLGKIMTICIGIVIALCFISLIICIPHIRKKLRLSGVIWMGDSKSNAIIFQYPMLGKPQLRFISENDDKTYSYTTSKDGSRILLSNGEIYTLCITQFKDNIESIELKRGETISTYCDLNRMKS